MAKQLKMWRPDSLPIPSTVVPAGFTLRTMRKGEEAAWSFCCLGQFGVEEATVESFYSKMDMSTILRSEVYFICENDRPVGTATARRKDGEPYLHYIAVHPDWRGKGLGTPLISAILAHHAAHGRRGCFLTTDDFRVPAVKLYLNMGYMPVYWSDDADERWTKLAEALGIAKPAALTPELGLVP